MGRATSATLSITRTVFWNPLRSVLFLLATLLAVMPLVAGAAATSGPLLAGARQAATPKAGSPGEPWLDLAWIALTPADGIGEGYGAIGG